MQVQDMKNKIESTMFSNAPYGIKVFACMSENESFIVKKFLTNDELRDSVKEIIESVIKERFLSDSIELDSSDNIADNRKVLYEIIQDESYRPFSFLNSIDEITDCYSETDQGSLCGLLFRINLNDSQIIWAYQHIYQVRMIKRSKSLYAMFANGDTYVPLDRDILKVDERIDILIIDNSIITSNISLLQQSFGFEKYVRAEAAKTISIIETLGIISDTSKLLAFEDKPTLTNAKKLLKAKHSPVLNMKKENLISGLQKHPRYKDKFKIEDDKIVINSQKDVNELIKMLNDDIVRSELTNQEYDSSTKHKLDPLPVN